MDWFRFGSQQSKFDQAVDRALHACIVYQLSDVLACNSLEEMARFAAPEIISTYQDEGFNQRQLKRFETIDYKQIFLDSYSTEFRDIAFLCLHASEPYREQWKNHLRQLIQVNNLQFKFSV